MRYFTVKDKTQDLNNHFKTGFVKGESTGWPNLSEHLTVKKGYPIFVAGAPHSGKTEFILELMLSLSIHKGYKWFVYTGEAGSLEELIGELCYKIIGKPYGNKVIHGQKISMSEAEKTYAEMVISEHFWFLDTEDTKSTIKDFTVDQFYALVDEVENSEGIKFDGTLIDPWNDVINETNEYGGREDLWLADALKVCRRDAKAKKRLNIVINHISDLKPLFDKETNRRYYPAALPSEWAGGRTWWRRAFLMLLIYRPPVFMTDPDNGIPYADNETHVIIQKAKPKGIAKLGRCKLYWDWKTNRYYEEPEFVTSPFVAEKKVIEPNLSFDETPVDDMPF
jgi:hypothetical protein